MQMDFSSRNKQTEGVGEKVKDMARSSTDTDLQIEKEMELGG